MSRMNPKMEQNKKIKEPDNTAVRTALWRALHMQMDAKPYVLEDKIGLKLIDPPDDWQQRPDMKFTKRLRASIVARARFIEDLIIEQSNMESVSMLFSVQDLTRLLNADQILLPNFRYMKLTNPTH